MSSDRLRAAADRLDTAEWLPASVDYATAALLRALAWEWDADRAVHDQDHHGESMPAALALADSILGPEKCKEHTANTYVRFDKDTNKWVCARCGEVSPVDQ